METAAEQIRCNVKVKGESYEITLGVGFPRNQFATKVFIAKVYPEDTNLDTYIGDGFLLDINDMLRTNCNLKQLIISRVTKLLNP